MGAAPKGAALSHAIPLPVLRRVRRPPSPDSRHGPAAGRSRHAHPRTRANGPRRHRRPGIALPAFGQEEGEDELATIESITVTITKREEDLQDVAASVSAFTAETIENANIEAVSDLATLLPGVVTKGEERTGAISVRGVSSGFTGQSAVARHVNGVFKRLPLSYSGQYYDLEGIEVQRGPVRHRLRPQCHRGRAQPEVARAPLRLRGVRRLHLRQLRPLPDAGRRELPRVRGGRRAPDGAPRRATRDPRRLPGQRVPARLPRSPGQGRVERAAEPAVAADRGSRSHGAWLLVRVRRGAEHDGPVAGPECLPGRQLLPVRSALRRRRPHRSVQRLARRDPARHRQRGGRGALRDHRAEPALSGPRRSGHPELPGER